MAKRKPKTTDPAQRFDPAAPIDSIQPHPRNVNDGDCGAIGVSMDANGFFGAVLVQESTGYILAGKHRWLVRKQRGAKTIPVLYQDVDDAAALRIMLADNRTARLGADDPLKLSELLQEILSDAGTLEGTGFTGDDLDELLSDLGNSILTGGGASDDSEIPKAEKANELQQKWGTAPGQLWHIGKHRLLIGDSTNAEDVARLTYGAKIDGICTDPPYDLDADTTVRAMENFSSVAVVLAADQLAFELTRFWTFRLDMIWRHRKARKLPTLNLPIMYHAHCLVLTRTPSVRTHWSKPEPGFGSVIEVEKEYEDAEFGHGKGADLFVQMMAGFSWKNVAEPFCGTGATIMACEATGRKCFAMELDPAHAAVAIERCANGGLRPQLEGANDAAV
jgi:hypothetical protein